MIRRSARAGLLTLILAVFVMVWGAAQPTLDQFSEALSPLALDDPGFVLEAIDIGLSTAGFPADNLLRVIDRLAPDPAASAEKERILRTLASALYDGLPIDDLITKTFEGLARRIPLPEIQRDLDQRLALLTELRDALYAVGIFSAPSGTTAVASALPTARFNQLLMNIADTVADYIDGGGSPLEGHAMYEEVRIRLMMLQGTVLQTEDVNLALERITPSDLTRAALAALS